MHQRHRAGRHGETLSQSPAVHRLRDLPSNVVQDDLNGSRLGTRNRLQESRLQQAIGLKMQLLLSLALVNDEEENECALLMLPFPAVGMTGLASGAAGISVLVEA